MRQPRDAFKFAFESLPLAGMLTLLRNLTDGPSQISENIILV